MGDDCDGYDADGDDDEDDADDGGDEDDDGRRSLPPGGRSAGRRASSHAPTIRACYSARVFSVCINIAICLA